MIALIHRANILSVIAALSLSCGSSLVCFAQSGEVPRVMTASNSREQENTKTILAIFHAIEERDDTHMLQFFQPDFEIHWPASLPYGGTFRGLKPRPHGWSATWEPLQPTITERKMDPRVVAVHGDDIVVLWRQRGVDAPGNRFDGEVLGLYRFRDGKLARAQMFYFDTAAVARFLAKAKN